MSDHRGRDKGGNHASSSPIPSSDFNTNFMKS